MVNHDSDIYFKEIETEHHNSARTFAIGKEEGIFTLIEREIELFGSLSSLRPAIFMTYAPIRLLRELRFGLQLNPGVYTCYIVRSSTMRYLYIS